MDRPKAQMRVVPEMVDGLAAMGEFTAYDRTITFEDGSVAVGVWTQSISALVLDDPGMSRIEIVICRLEDLNG